MAELLSDADVEQKLDGSEWKREGDEIVRNWKFNDFAEAMAFVNRVAARPRRPTITRTSSCTGGTT
jgi:pterin-4a-carbinolamine dehydratase